MSEEEWDRLAVGKQGVGWLHERKMMIREGKSSAGRITRVTGSYNCTLTNNLCSPACHVTEWLLTYCDTKSGIVGFFKVVRELVSPDFVIDDGVAREGREERWTNEDAVSDSEIHKGDEL